MEWILSWLPDSPLVAFTILLLIILTLPPLFQRLRLPGLVGLLFAGVVFGSDGLGLLNADSEAIKLLSDIGKVYLMFVAGLEIDLAEFRASKNRSMIFGVSTFSIPLVLGTGIGLLFGYGLNASVLMGSLFASHTLLGYPIVQRLGILRNQAVTVTVGATIFTDISALLVLAICVSIHHGEFTLVSLITQLVTLALYTVAVLFGLAWAGRAYFRRTGDESSNQFLFILLAVFLASVGAQVIQVDKIVGAFLAGLAVNDVVGRGPVKEKIEFVGSTLFIPFFFVGMGLILEVPALVQSLTTSLALTLAVLAGLFLSKLLAVLIVKFLFGYSWNEAMTMWSLSLPQVAATLAAALAGVNAGLLPEPVFNAVIVLMVATSLAGPLLTEKFAVRLPLPTTATADWQTEPDGLLAAQAEPPFAAVVTLKNRSTANNLLKMAALLVQPEVGRLIPLSIVKAHVHMDEPYLQKRIRQGGRLLRRAEKLVKTFEIKAQGVLRIDDDIAEGISRTAREQNANLIVMGWSTVDLRSRLFGSVPDSVFWSAHCPVAVARLLDEPANIQRILVPVKVLTADTLKAIRFAGRFAETNQAAITLLHVADPRVLPEQIADFETHLQKVLGESRQFEVTIKTVLSDQVADTILIWAQGFDLVVLRSMRRRTVGGLAVSDVTTEVIKDLKSSLVLFGEPHS